MVADMFVAGVDPTFEHSKFIGELIDYTIAGTWNPASAGGFLIEENGKLYNFFCIGPRLNNKIALAIAPLEEKKIIPLSMHIG